MDFLNKAKKSISNAGRELGQKAGDMSTMAKMNLKIREKEKNLKDYYKRLGDLIYNEYPDEAMRMYPELTKLISNLKLDIECERHELAPLKAIKSAPTAAPNNHKTANFARHVGGMWRNKRE